MWHLFMLIINHVSLGSACIGEQSEQSVERLTEGVLGQL